MKILNQKDSAIKHLKIASQNIENTFKATNKLKLFNQIISNWEKVLSESDSTTKELELKITPNFIKVEAYDYPISFNPDDYDFILTWDINLAIQDLVNQGKETSILNLNSIMITEESLNKEAFYVKIENPIIIILNNTISPVGYTLINGNHRINEAKEQKIAQLVGYLVNDHDHLQWMTTDLMRNFYLMIQDLKVISYYL